MAKTSQELFTDFAARAAEILRERFGMDPEALLRVRADRFTIEGLVQRAPDGAAIWHEVRVTPEQLEWSGPNAMAEAFVTEYVTAFRRVE